MFDLQERLESDLVVSGLQLQYVTLVLVPYQETWKVNICRPT